MAEKGYGREPLGDLSRVIEAEDSDLYDVLAYIAFCHAPISREERVVKHRNLIFEGYSDRQREFIDFVLNQYVHSGVEELDQAKLPDLLELKYNGVADAINHLGAASDIRELFVSFQRRLYVEGDVA